MQSEIIKADPDTYFHIKFTGDFSIKEFIGAYTGVVSHPSYRPGTHIIWDAREASFAHLSQRDIATFCTELAGVAVDRAGGKGACLVSRAVDYGLTRMFEIFAEGAIRIDFQVFYSVDDAVKWFQEG